MELWIRSQDKKKLHSVKHLELDNNETGIFIADTYTLLGKYATKERALEVLDEITKRKDELDKSYFLGMDEASFVSSIYEMPEE